MQDLEPQRLAMMERFNLKDPLILKERGSAYRLENMKNRTEFIKLLNMCFDNQGITNIFMQDYVRKEINIYVWDLNRIMRNLLFNMLFSVLSCVHDIKIYSYSDKEINSKSKSLDEEFISLLLAMLSAKKAQDYSDDISKNTKKSVFKVDEVTTSSKGNKWGRRFKNGKGESIELSVKKINEMIIFVMNRIRYFKNKHISCYYGILIKEVEAFNGVSLSRAYLTKLSKQIKNDK